MYKEDEGNRNGKPIMHMNKINNREKAEFGKDLADGTTPYSVPND